MDPLAFITALAQDAGALLCERLDDPRDVAEKRPHDLVTDADRASEALIVRRIRETFPQAAILGEEIGAYTPAAATSASSSIRSTERRTTRTATRCSASRSRTSWRASSRRAPCTRRCCGELFTARRGGGATRNGEPMRVSAVERVADAFVCTGFNPANYPRNGPYFAHVSDRAQAVRRDGSAALDLAFVAAGVYDAFWEWDLGAWDVAAGALLIEEAGGRATSIAGTPLDVAAGSILATNAAVHAEMQQLLAEVQP